MIIQIWGTPVAQPRHRVCIRGNHPHAYIPEKHKIHGWKAWIAENCGIGMEDKKPMTVPISVNLQFTLPRPKSLPKKIIHHTKKPDIDNLIKAVLDAMNGIIYKDDSQICELGAIKIYGENLGVIISIGEYYG